MGAALFAVGRKLVQRCLPLERQRRYWAVPCLSKNFGFVRCLKEFFCTARLMGIPLTAVSVQGRCPWTPPPFEKGGRKLSLRDPPRFQRLLRVMRSPLPFQSMVLQKSTVLLFCLYHAIMAKKQGGFVMHYTGTIWRPPYEASSLLLEATAGCTHHGCKFCTLYNDLPFKFRMSPLKDIESDLQEAQLWSTDPIARLTARLREEPRPERIRRAFLVGANPFVLKYDRLMAIANRIQKYIPSVNTIGCFARITDIAFKSDEELTSLHRAGYDGLTIGMETGDEEALRFMNKGYTAAEIVKQCRRLDLAGIHYSFFYLVGISGAGRGEIGAKATADVCSQLHPSLIGANMLTVYPDSELYQEIQLGNWKEAGELEKYKEIRTLLENLEIPVQFAALGASNAFQFQGTLPENKASLAAALDRIIETVRENDLREYRVNLRHL